MSPFNNFNLPGKVYLTGADCFHLVLDKHAKKHGAGGNVMRKIFYFSHSILKEKIESILTRSSVIHWSCNIELVQGSLFTKPYWNYKDRGNSLILQEHTGNIENEIPPTVLERDITIDSTHFIEADLVHYPSGACAFILSWNHILMDAKGTTLLFEHLENIANDTPADPGHFFPAKEKRTGIIEYIRNMYKVKRFVQNSSRPPVSSVANAGKSADGDTRYKTISFSTGDTRKINENAFKTGSRFGPTLYFVACCSHVINELNEQRNAAGDIWLPVPYDGRLKGATGPLVSNCVSFLFYRIPKNKLGSIKDTVSCLSAQMTEQLRDRIPQRYNTFLNMMRHIPLWLYYFLISRTGKGVFASFLYTSTGENFNEMKELFGEPIRDMAMIPALTYPPGLTFIFLKHDDQLNVNIAYSSAVIHGNELFLIEQRLKEILPANY